VPAAWEQGWANLKSAIAIPHYRVETSWLFAHHTDPGLLQYSHDEHLQAASWVAVSMIAVTMLGALVAWMRGTLPGPRRWWIPSLLVPFVILFLLLPISLPVWDYLPRLRYLQFPWRWLLVLEAPMAIFFAAAVWFVPVRRRIVAVVLCGLLFLGLSVGAGRYWFRDCGTDQDMIAQAEEIGMGVYGKPEYAPAGANYSDVRFNQPGACLVSDLATVLGQPSVHANPSPPKFRRGGCEAGLKAILYEPEHKRITGVADQAGYLILKIRSYPAWRVTVNGQPATPVVERGYGLIAVAVPQGPVNVVVDWSTTPDVIAGRWTSCLSRVLLTGLWLLERKLNRPRLS
jgi:hypothetical protein